MTEAELNQLVSRLGIPRAERLARLLRELMPTLIHTRAGAKTLAFITALEAATVRAKCRSHPDAK